MATITEPVVHGRQVASELKTNTLTLFDTTVIATSSVAPAYTLAATAAVLIAAVGLQSPAAILVGFFPVLFIAIAYYYLNRMDPNCGASYSWVSRTLNPYIGWLSGWVQLAANILFCAAAPLLAGTYTLRLLNSLFPGQISQAIVTDPRYIAAAGATWLALVTFMVVRGIRITANFQWVLVFIEYFIVLGFAVLAIAKVATGHAPTQNHFAGNWFSPFSLGNLDNVVVGAALAVFFFWGWDTAANVNEETKDASTSPGLAGIFSMFILLFIFLLAAVAIQMFLSTSDIGNNTTDILYFFSQQLTGSPLSYLMILAVLSSTVATTQTTLLPSSRLTFSMARDGVFPRWFGKVHRSWRTPWVGTIISAILSLAIIIVTLLSPSFNNNIFARLILDIGVLVAVYYGVTGFASAWAFRKVLLTTPGRFLFAGLLPAVGGLLLFFVAYAVLVPSSTGLKFAQAADWATGLPVLVLIGIGLPLLLMARVASRSGFFTEKTVSYVDVGGQLSVSAPGTPIA
ncbi:MAG: APC family permease [Candidatus Dormibacteraeota bacterium]|nr:APC family permease [Candidatus Dormibacteraeota bacterium]MBV9524824.1 APC family permease [Candidatus Dormibacteraeota bacterium]